MKCLFFLALAAALCGCSTIVKLGPAEPDGGSKVTLVDKRPADQKMSSRASTFSPLRFYGDNEFQPPALSVFRGALAAKLPYPIRVEVTQLRIADYFPHRLSIGGSGLVAALMKKISGYSEQDLKAIAGVNVSSNKDGVICLVSVAVNGETFKAGAFEPYSPGAAVMVASNSSFRRAARKAIEQTASEIATQLAARQ